jgi:3-hydroxyacyl-CoA dehydrogenase / 3-hydroxy-2-methylbutyryl-CoA dehydrogenase
VGDSAQIAFAVRETRGWIERTGKVIGGVIAAAGVARPGKVMGMDREGMRQFDEVMRINVRGTVDLVRYFLPLLATCPLPPEEKDGERGVVVLVSSAAAFDGQPGQVAYAASKGAIASLTLPLTREVARYGIRVVTIAPSLFETAMTTNISARLRESLNRVLEFPRRAGRPEEFARLVREGLENSMLNGVVIRLDGGVRLPSKF